MTTLSLRCYASVEDIDLSNGVRAVVPDAPPISLRALMSAALPGVPMDLQVQTPDDWGDNCASWRAPIHAGFYELQCGESYGHQPDNSTVWTIPIIDDYSHNPPTPTTDPITNTTVHFRPQQGSEWCYCRVRGVNALGPGDWTAPIPCFKIEPPPKPKVNYFSVSPPGEDSQHWYLPIGNWATLTWSVDPEGEATVVNIDFNGLLPSIKNAGLTGSFKFQPGANTDHVAATLSAANSGGTAKAYVYIDIYLGSSTQSEQWYFFEITRSSDGSYVTVMSLLWKANDLDGAETEVIESNWGSGYTAIPISEDQYNEHCQ